jgi:diguanylate cyclase (GGDEF)-like protein
MNGLAQSFGRFSLRQRFLVGPLLGLILLCALAAAFTWELHGETRLLKRLNDVEIAAYDRYSEVFVNLAEQHMALLDLLHATRGVDEEQLYEAKKRRLDRIANAVSDLEQTLQVAPPRDADTELFARHRELFARTLDYRNAASSAVTMPTLRFELSRSHITALNAKFTAMEQAFVSFLKAERASVRAEIASRVQRGETESAMILVGGVSAALLLMALSVILSRLLARALEAQIAALGALGAEAGSAVAVEGNNEIERIASAIAVFRKWLRRLQQSEQALTVTNVSLTTALEQVRIARTDLERRVQERTRELQEANTALMLSEEQLQRLAFYDGLTGLPNRALLNDRLRMALATAERQHERIAVMYLDLDGFKDVNDTLGHASGDGLLIEIGQRIGRCIRGSDTLARTGGDEFTVLLANAGSTDDVTTIAQRIIEAVALPIDVSGQAVHVGTSIGISFYPDDGADAETLQVAADRAMYKAKKAGRGQYRLFEGGFAARGNEVVSLPAALESALANEQFAVFYQPIVNAASGRIERVEALLRWRKPGSGLALPDAFMPHADEGLLRRIDAWVLERACRDARRWLKDADAPAVSVNLSAASLQQGRIAHTVAAALERAGLAPPLLNVEVSERALASQARAVRESLESIAALGVGVSLDDFGTRESSACDLACYPIDCVKLDLALVDRIGRDTVVEERIRALRAIAARLGLRVVAEGVEHGHQQAFLAQLGCDLMQGYRFVRPMPGDMLPDWLAANGASLALETRSAEESGASKSA